MNLHDVSINEFQIMVEKTKKYLSYHPDYEEHEMLQTWKNPLMIFVPGEYTNENSRWFINDLHNFYKNNFKEKKSDYDYNKYYLAKNSIWYPFSHSFSEGDMLLNRILNLRVCVYTKTNYPFLNRKKDSNSYSVGDGCHAKTLRNNIVFWNLFLLSIDEELYESELKYVLDIIYCLGFDRVMIEDWCNAINYILTGNYLGDNCDLHFESDDANEYFLHHFTYFD